MKVSILDKFSFVAAVFIVVVGFLVEKELFIVTGILTVFIIGAKFEILDKLDGMK